MHYRIVKGQGPRFTQFLIKFHICMVNCDTIIRRSHSNTIVGRNLHFVRCFDGPGEENEKWL